MEAAGHATADAPAGAPAAQHRPPPPPPKRVIYDLTTCATLISTFDFQHRGYVDREDWQRGCRMMLLSDMGNDDQLWATLLQKFGMRGEEDAVDLRRIEDLTPMDPRMNLMMKAMVASVAGVSERLERAQKRAQDQSASRANRVILTMRRQIMQPVLTAWAALVRERLRLARKALRCALHADLGKAWRQWTGVCEAAAAMRQQLDRFVRRFGNREVGRCWNHWFGLYEFMLKLRAVGRRLRCAPYPALAPRRTLRRGHLARECVACSPCTCALPTSTARRRFTCAAASPCPQLARAVARLQLLVRGSERGARAGGRDAQGPRATPSPRAARLLVALDRALGRPARQHTQAQ